MIQYLVLEFVSNLGMDAGFSLPNPNPITINVGEPFQARLSRVETRSHRKNNQKPRSKI